MECTKDKMIVTLEYAPIVKIDLDKVTLKDDDCQLSEYGSLNNTHLMMNTPLDSCKTNYTAEGDTITYQNSLIVKSRDGGGEDSEGISREFTTEFIFTCSYPSSALASVVNFSPREKVIYTKTGKALEIVFNTLLIEEVNLIELIRFKEYCGMPRGHEHHPIHSVSKRAFRGNIFLKFFKNKILVGKKNLFGCNNDRLLREK